MGIAGRGNEAKVVNSIIGGHLGHLCCPAWTVGRDRRPEYRGNGFQSFYLATGSYYNVPEKTVVIVHERKFLI